MESLVSARKKPKEQWLMSLCQREAGFYKKIQKITNTADSILDAN